MVLYNVGRSAVWRGVMAMSLGMLSLPIEEASPRGLNGAVHVANGLLYGGADEGVALSAHCRYCRWTPGRERKGGDGREGKGERERDRIRVPSREIMRRICGMH